MLSAISQRWPAAVLPVTGSFTAAVFIEFLGRLLGDSGGRKVHLIVEASGPLGQARQRLLGATPRGCRPHFLPGYSPSWNPVELLNQDVKANAAGRRRARWP